MFYFSWREGVPRYLVDLAFEFVFSEGISFSSGSAPEPSLVPSNELRKEGENEPWGTEFLTLKKNILKSGLYFCLPEESRIRRWFLKFNSSVLGDWKRSVEATVWRFLVPKFFSSSSLKLCKSDFIPEINGYDFGGQEQNSQQFLFHFILLQLILLPAKPPSPIDTST